MPDDFPQGVQASDKAWVTAQFRARLPVIVSDKKRGLLEGSAPQTALYQGHSKNFGVGKMRLAVILPSPLRPLQVLGERVSDKNVDTQQSVFDIVYTAHGCCSLKCMKCGNSIVLYEQ